MGDIAPAFPEEWLVCSQALLAAGFLRPRGLSRSISISLAPAARPTLLWALGRLAMNRAKALPSGPLAGDPVPFQRPLFATVTPHWAGLRACVATVLWRPPLGHFSWHLSRLTCADLASASPALQGGSVAEPPAASGWRSTLCPPGSRSPGKGAVVSQSHAVSQETPPGSDVTVGPTLARVLCPPPCGQTGFGRQLEPLEDGVGIELLCFFKCLVQSVFSHKSSPRTTLCVSEDSGLGWQQSHPQPT